MFAPIREHGGPQYFVDTYWDNERVRKDLGNLSYIDAIDFLGRGFIQITGRNNYSAYGRELGIDLIARPDLAMQPEIAAKILAKYFANREVHIAALAKDWHLVRRKVNGGLNGFDRFIQAITQLGKDCDFDVNP